MSFIEGIGDEVILFVGIVVIALALLVGWIAVFGLHVEGIYQTSQRTPVQEEVSLGLQARESPTTEVDELQAQERPTTEVDESQFSNLSVTNLNRVQEESSNSVVVGEMAHPHKDTSIRETAHIQEDTAISQTIHTQEDAPDRPTAHPPDNSSGTETMVGQRDASVVHESRDGSLVGPTDQPETAHREFSKSNSEIQEEDQNVVRQRRLQFFERLGDPYETGAFEDRSLYDGERNQEIANSLGSEVGEPVSSQPTLPQQPVSNGDLPSSMVTNSSENDDSAEIQIRLKYLNDTERLVLCRLQDNVGDFKRKYFSEDLANNKTVRLIFNGQLMRNDDSSLQVYGVTNGCVIHVQISPTPLHQGMPPTPPVNELDLGHLMLPLFFVILGLLWMLYFEFTEYFDTNTSVLLLGLSALFCLVMASYFRPDNAGARVRR
ncbi:transmembrane and ubiquitin-like domain-containing protein 2 [Limulus polyphemus]|uniref:Transmembrane and ubiquitin-like domain-containing protein 2 n=1 Tax=Limulus polyphemus TaxID=6850 RepID=A0ABM1B9L2_LIMPO|nr:transmembrane and ubiquitin-like domain-containing protein 2 [Limulus polyphemus]XP_013777613.1 transmembrane and ubiquitin-like domain-containing protein 2 [Limulus polyphemus]XP_022245163.1 transmembrane and ubiquitin-like domain-containing protein 2 [Limulus polyphemus]